MLSPEPTLRRLRAGTALTLAVLAVLVGFLAFVPPAPAAPTGHLRSDAGGFSVSLTFSPSSIAENSTATGSVSFASGTPPFVLWVNQSAPGCSPQSNPQTASANFQFSCSPTSPGTWNFNFEAVDSSTPAQHASGSAALTVRSSSSGGGGGGTGNNSSGGFQLPTGLLSTAILFGAVFLFAFVALAAGVVAMAILIPRRLRQLNETLGRQGTPAATSAKEPAKP